MYKYTVNLLLLGSLILIACTLGAREKSNRSFYTDREVETFIERFPQLGNPINGNPEPEDILQRLEIEINALQVIDIYIGDCPTLTVYELSPSYELVVDENACFGYQVHIRER
jgi:hypothetical protein